MTTVEKFLADTKKKCEAKAKEMAALELSIFDENHKKELIQNFGFTAKEVAERKNELKQIVDARIFDYVSAEEFDIMTDEDIDRWQKFTDNDN